MIGEIMVVKIIVIFGNINTIITKIAVIKIGIV